MPAKTLVSLLLIVIAAAGFTVLAAQQIGLPMAAFGLVAALAALALRVWMDKK